MVFHIGPFIPGTRMYTTYRGHDVDVDEASGLFVVQPYGVYVDDYKKWIDAHIAREQAEPTRANPLVKFQTKNGKAISFNSRGNRKSTRRAAPTRANGLLGASDKEKVKRAAVAATREELQASIDRGEPIDTAPRMEAVEYIEGLGSGKKHRYLRIAEAYQHDYPGFTKADFADLGRHLRKVADAMYTKERKAGTLDPRWARKNPVDELCEILEIEAMKNPKRRKPAKRKPAARKPAAKKPASRRASKDKASYTYYVVFRGPPSGLNIHAGFATQKAARTFITTKAKGTTRLQVRGRAGLEKSGHDPKVAKNWKTFSLAASLKAAPAPRKRTTAKAAAKKLTTKKPPARKPAARKPAARKPTARSRTRRNAGRPGQTGGRFGGGRYGGDDTFGEERYRELEARLLAAKNKAGREEILEDLIYLDYNYPGVYDAALDALEAAENAKARRNTGRRR